jgi:glycosyltransferase involved in cell wall biosynthesis
MKRALIISETSYPHGSAYSTRITCFVKILNRLGFECHVISDIYTENSDDNKNESLLCSYEALGKDTSISSQILNWHRSKVTICRYLKNYHVDLVVCGSASIRYILYNRICRRNGIKVIADANEWYSVSTFTLGFLDARYWLHNLSLRVLYKKNDGLIVTSTLFKEYYSNNNVIIIPSMLDVSVSSFNESDHTRGIRLIYAGNPGTRKNPKERFESIINGMLLVKMAGVNASLDLYGVTKKQICEISRIDEDIIDELDGYLRFRGKVSNAEILKAYQNSSFSLYIRPERKSSNAGFATKIAESLMSGTPVITNATGDTCCYIKTGINGYIIKDNPEAILSVILAITELTDTEKNEMRKYSRLTAENFFDYTSYIESFSRFLSETGIP